MRGKTSFTWRILIVIVLTVLSVLPSQFPVFAAASLTITPITWNVVGLDSNNVNAGPNNFPIGARVCNTGDAPATNVSADFVWDSADAYINLRTGSKDPITLSSLSNVAPNNCHDFYFEVAITRDSAAYDNTRDYHITVTADGGISVSTPANREIYVEHLVSQNRNSVSDVKLDGVSVPAGGTLNLVIGQTYTIQLVGSTATNGYEQIESFINFPNTIFLINSVATTYAHDEGTDPNAGTKLYADGCGWVNDTTSGSYRSCSGVGKYGNNITVTYNVTIIATLASSGNNLNTLIYDFSGSSYHYNSDFSTSARIYNIIDPATCTQSTITQWNFDSSLTDPSQGSGTITAVGLSAANSDQGNPNSGNARSHSDWDEGGEYLQFAASTVGYTAIHFLFDAKRSNNGPSTLNITYHNGSSEIAESTQSLATTNWYSFNRNLSSNSSINNNPNALFRVYGTGTTINAGTLRFDNVTVTGCALPASINLTKTGAIDQTIAAPTNQTNVGDYINYTIVITNNGGGNLTGITLTDSQAASLACTPALSGLSLTPSQSTTCTGFHALTQSDFDAGSVTNLATANSAQAGPVTASTTQSLPQTKSLTLDKTTSTPNYSNAGNSISYSYLLTNSGTVTLFAPYDVTDDKALVTCPGLPASIAPGASVTCTAAYIVSQADVDAGSVTNTATASAKDAALGGANVTSNSDSVTVNAVQTPGITIVKEVSINGGSTWQDANSAPGPYLLNGTNPQFRFTVTNTGNVTLTGLTLTDTDFSTAGCTIPGSLTPGGSFTCTVTGAWTAGQHTDTATASGSFGGTPYSDTDDANYFGQAPSFTITKVADVASVDAAGDVINYTITLTNTGNMTLTGVTITDTRLSSLSCAPAQPGTVAPGGTMVCTGSYTVTQADINAGGTLDNTATGDTDQTPPSDASESVTVTQNPELTLTKTASPATYSAAGEIISYSFLVENTGNVTVDGPFTVSDDKTADEACPAIPSSLEPGGTIICTASYLTTVTDITNGSVTNTASASGTFGGNPVPSNTDSETVTFVDVFPSVTLSKSADDISIPETGQSVTFTFSVTNTGTQPATITALSDSVFSVSGDADCQIGTVLAAGASCDFSIAQNISGDYPGSHVNTGSVTITDGDGDTATDTDNETIAFEDVLPDVSLTKAANDNSVPETGQSVTFTFTVKNNSAESASITALSDDVFGALAGDGDCQVGTVLASGGTCSFDVTRIISGDFPGSHVNTGSVTAADDDGNTDTATDGETITFEDVLPDMAVSKSASPTSVPAAGGSVTFTIEVTNNSSEAAALTFLSDDQFNDITTTGHDGITATTCAAGGSIAAGGTYSCTFTATVSGTVGVDHVNVVTATVSDDEGNTDSATDNATVSFILSDFTVTKDVDDAVIYSGDTVMYTITVVNTGDVPLTNIIVDDGLTGCVLSGPSGDAGNDGILGVTETWTYTCSLALSADTTNTVTVQADDSGGNTLTRTDNATVNVINPSLSVTKTADSTLINSGDTVTYTITVANTGDDPLASVSVDDGLAGCTLSGPSGDTGSDNILGIGETWAYTCSLALTADTTNTANVTAEDSLNNTVSGNDNEFVDVRPTVTLDKSPSPASLPEPGGVFTYTLTITNTASESVTITSLTDTNPLSAACNALVGTVLGAGNSTSCTYAVSQTNVGTYPNTANVEVQDSENNTATDGASASVEVTDELPSITVDKTANPTSLDEPGGDVTFTVVVTNNSVEPVMLTSLSDDVYGDLDGQGDCSMSQTIAAGGTYSCSFTKAISGSPGDIRTDTVTAVAYDNEENSTSDTDDAAVTIVDVPSSIAVTKTASPTSVIEPGGSVTFTVRVDNTSAVDAVTITSLTDNIHGNLNGQGTCSAPQTIAASSFYQCSFTATVSGSGGASETDTVVASGSDDDGNPVGGSDNATVDIIARQADLSLLKVVDNANPYYGTNVIFTISVTNSGPDPATGVHVRDVLPSGFTYVLDNPSQGVYNNGTGDWDVGSLAVNQTETLTITARVVLGGSYNNTAEVSAVTEVDPDSTPANNNPAEDDQAGASVTPQQDDPSGLSKSVLSTSEASTTDPDVAIGEIVTYEVNVVIPPGIFPDARLVDTMGRGLAYDGCAGISAGTLATSIVDPNPFDYVCTHPIVDSNGSLDPQDIDRRVTFDFGTLTNSGSTPVTLTVRYRAVVLDIAANIAGVGLDNSANWYWDVESTLDPVTARVSIVEPKLIIDKTADIGFVAVGSEVTFTINIAHVVPPGSPASSANAFDVLVEDVLPAEFEYVTGTLDCTLGSQDADVNCAYDPVTRAIRAQWSQFTLTGGNGQIRFRARTLSIPGSGNITNSARVEWTSLPGAVGPQSYTPNIYSTERYYDPADPAGVNAYSTSDSITLTPLGGGGGDDDDDGGAGGTKDTGGTGFNIGGFLIPVTGFAPNEVTALNGSPVTYTAAGKNSIEIAALGLKLPIVGVPLQNREWNIKWLWDQAGWLEGTAYPGWDGNSVITAHVVTADGKPGPFARLRMLRVGEYIVVNANGSRYTYKVISNRLVEPDDIRVLRHEEKAWITLITCDDYDEDAETYLKRVAVRAVLVDVTPAK